MGLFEVVGVIALAMIVQFMICLYYMINIVIIERKSMSWINLGYAVAVGLILIGLFGLYLDALLDLDALLGKFIKRGG